MTDGFSSEGTRSAAPRILILGGDGFCGWPTALHLSEAGFDIAIVDNLSRREINAGSSAGSLTPIRPIEERLQAWQEVSGHEILFHALDAARDYARLTDLIADWQPEAIVHLAEQRADRHSTTASFNQLAAIDNNLKTTHNLLAAISVSGVDAHLIHLGALGIRGDATMGLRIPETYRQMQARFTSGEPIEAQSLRPATPGDIHHLALAQNQLAFAFHNRNAGIRVTELRHGIVWGTQTTQSRRDNRLINRFDYGDDDGSVLNRFLMQAAIGQPLTVHGTGGQTRAFTHIQDILRCIQRAIENAPGDGQRVRIYNQMTETHRVRDLAAQVARCTGARIEFVPNPRPEAAENDLYAANDHLIALGRRPVTLDQGLLGELTDVAARYAWRCDASRLARHPTAGISTARFTALKESNRTSYERDTAAIR